MWSNVPLPPPPRPPAPRPPRERKRHSLPLLWSKQLRKYSRPPPRTPPPRVPSEIRRGQNSRFVHKTHHDLRDHHLEREMDVRKKNTQFAQSNFTSSTTESASITTTTCKTSWQSIRCEQTTYLVHGLHRRHDHHENLKQMFIYFFFLPLSRVSTWDAFRTWSTH